MLQKSGFFVSPDSGPGSPGPVGFGSGSGLVQPLVGPGAEWSARNSVFLPLMFYKALLPSGDNKINHDERFSDI